MAKKIIITVLSASNLLIKDASTSSSDPYVEIVYGSNKHATKAIKQSLNPEWNESFTYDYPNSATTVSFHLWDLDKEKSDDLGVATFDIGKDGPKLGESKTVTLKILVKGKEPAGTLTVAFRIPDYSALTYEQLLAAFNSQEDELHALKKEKADALAAKHAAEKEKADALAAKTAVEKALADALTAKHAAEKEKADALAVKTAVEKALADALTAKHAAEKEKADALAAKHAAEKALADFLAASKPVVYAGVPGIVSKNATFLFKFGELNCSGYISLSKDGNLYSSDYGASLIRIFSREGKLLSSFGSEGTGDGQFKQPSRVVFSKDGNLFISDSNGRIQVFDSTGKFLRRFGQGEITRPYGLAIDKDDNIYVSDISRNRVQIFEKTGNVKGKLGDYVEPQDIQISQKSGKILVTDKSGLFILNPNGSLIKKIASPSHFPKAAAFDGEDNIVYIDNSFCTSPSPIQLLDSAGNPIGSFGGLELVANWYSKGVAVDHEGRFYVAQEHKVHVFGGAH